MKKVIDRKLEEKFIENIAAFETALKLRPYCTLF